MGTEVKAWLLWCMKERDVVYKKHTQSYTHTDAYICIYIWCEWRERQAAKQKLKKFRDTMDAQIVEREKWSRERETACRRVERNNKRAERSSVNRRLEYPSR